MSDTGASTPVHTKAMHMLVAQAAVPTPQVTLELTNALVCRPTAVAAKQNIQPPWFKFNP
jgi:hypothetical protein